MASVFGFGEEVAVIGRSLLQKAIEEQVGGDGGTDREMDTHTHTLIHARTHTLSLSHAQAPQAQKAYGQEAGAADSDVLLLRLDMQSACDGSARSPGQVWPAALIMAPHRRDPQDRQPVDLHLAPQAPAR
jgi:hypothetical protein